MQAGGLKFRMQWLLGLRSVAALGPSILTRSPIDSGSAFTARIFSGPPFGGFSPVTRLLPLITHFVSPLVENYDAASGI
jgi:hypothetical protein